MTVALRYLVDVARFTAVDLAHELRRDYERGVFSKQTLAMIGGSSAVAVAAIAKGAFAIGVVALLTAGLFTYQPAQADRRWRDERRDDP
ncbi:hypothetical protein GS429_04315 [Natronorubrum sp. JWXQ-INN-674]|uniref:Uncharacterized protein n=1 Tax=Natronorubrum halalkaliphilum TaxID=2691917 RepID=A0A6B0VIB9_9EURY|nr:hypothetical protein [Natronorubrum halalkaliphilum]MXV61300.1 hypothetical protein [Natronorubrum halalkaliphilum]